MKPVFGNAATSAPKAASFRSTRRGRRRRSVNAIVQSTISSAAQQVDAEQRRVRQLEQRRARAEAEQHARQREEQHEGVQPRDRAVRQHAARAASQPSRTSAKNGMVTARMACMRPQYCKAPRGCARRGA